MRAQVVKSPTGKTSLAHQKTHHFSFFAVFLGETSYGVARNKIIKQLKSLEKYKCVKRDNIVSALDNLLVSGDIYETKDYHYRLI